MQLFYAPNVEELPYLDENDSKHCVKVLRKVVGDRLHLMDGKGNFFEAEITSANPKKCLLQVVSKTTLPPPAKHVTIAIAPTKNADRLEWFVEKAVEIGIQHIQLIITQHSERKFQKTDRLERIAIAAAKQSLTAYLPTIAEPVEWHQWIGEQSDSQLFIAHLEEDAMPLARIELASNITVAIGPEGDFTPAELVAAKQAGFQTVTLGNTRLRTETAGLVACTLINCL